MLKVKNGRLVLPSGMSYRMLVLPDMAAMSPEILEVIGKLVDDGAVVVGKNRPERAPGLRNYPARDAEAVRLADEIWPKVVSGKSPAEVLDSLGIKPDFSAGDEKYTSNVQWELFTMQSFITANNAKQVSYIHRDINGMDCYFVACSNQKGADVKCTFRVSRKTPEFWYPDTGETERVPVYEEKDGMTAIPIRFAPSGSVFVVFRKPAPGEGHAVDVKYTAAKEKDLKTAPADGGYQADEIIENCMEVTDIVRKSVAEGKLTVEAADHLYGDPAPGVVKQLWVNYRVNGVNKQLRIIQYQSGTLPKGAEVIGAWYGHNIPDAAIPVHKTVTAKHATPLEPATTTPPPAYEVRATGNGSVEIRAWESGSFEVAMASGKTWKTGLVNVPDIIDIGCPWQLSFPPDWGTPPQVTLDKLISWTEHADPGVKYFSGTAVYEKTFTWDIAPAPDTRVVLDLGALRNFAEVRLNGRPFPVLWKPPYRLDITEAVQTGENTLQIEVTNLWPNRLIGDEQLPDDREWEDTHLAAWPQWVLDGKPSPTGRFTFTTWHHWQKDDAPLPSGLFGPVQLRQVKSVGVD
jgi:hypothetical protein